MLITNVPKSAADSLATPTDLNRWLSNEANQVIDEFQNLLDDTNQTKSASDLFQTSKAVARYVFGNTIVEDNGTSTHNGSVDIYIVQRDGGDSKKLPAVLLRGLFPVKIINANQSNNVSLQLGTTAAKEWKKFDMAGNLTEIAVGEFRANDIVFASYDSDDDVYIVKKAFSEDEVKAIAGKFNILNFLDFTASAPVAGGTIGDRYINTTAGTISAGTVDAAGTTVVANKIYELYDISGAYNWREIDEQDGNIVFNDNDKLNYLNTGNSWNLNYSNVDKYSMSGFVPTSGSDADEEVTVSVGKALCEDGSTVLNLTATATDLDFPTLLGGALGNDTTYHLFAFLKNDNTVDWHLETSLTPTIATINSSLAYRRIFSAKTDSSGDLISFIGYKKISGNIFIDFGTGITEGSNIESATKATITLGTIPLGLPLDVSFTLTRTNSSSGNQYYYLFNPNIDPTVNVVSSDFSDGIGGGGSYDNGGRINFKTINTLSQISHKGTTGGDISLGALGFNDYRNYY